VLVKAYLFVSKVFWVGLVVSIFMLSSGILLLFVPLYRGEGLFIMFFSFVTVAIVVMSNRVLIQMQKWMVDKSGFVDKTLTLRAVKSNEALNPLKLQECGEEFEIYEAFEPYEGEAEAEKVEETEIPA
jgi:hypothetical protein